MHTVELQLSKPKTTDGWPLQGWLESWSSCNWNTPGELSPLPRHLITSALPRSSRIQNQIIFALVRDLRGFSWKDITNNVRIDWNWGPSALFAC